MLKGYMGSVLRVDLTNKHLATEPIPDQWLRNFIGGAGTGIRFAYDEIPPQADPLGELNKLLFLTGPVTSTVLGTSGRYEVVFKSPLTGILCDCSSSGFWGSELKKAGYDGLIIEGTSESWVYLYIHDDRVEIRDAATLVGKDTLGIQDLLRREAVDAKARVLSIGIAGEAGVLYSCIVNDEARVAGRGGGGAVMGAKKLKAIVVRGTQPVHVYDAEGFNKVAAAINRRNATDPRQEMIRKYGTAWVLDGLWPISNIPTKNWTLPSSEQICTRLGGKRLRENYMPHASRACYRCTIGCARWVKIDKGPYAMDGPGPEYETLSSLGSLCLIDDLEAVCYANHLCNLYGIDTMSCGSTIAFAMECFERGILTPEETGGLNLSWGNAEVLITLIHKIAHREAIGALLGMGTRRMAHMLGNGAVEFAMHVKGLEMPMHDARAGFAWASNYATSPRGACHLHGMTSWYEESENPIPEWGFSGKHTRLSNQGKGKMTRFAQNWAHILDSMVLCYFASRLLKPSDLAALINLATGSEYTPLDLLKVADRINALHRAYNVRCGIKRKDDTLPPRALMPLKEGFTAGQAPDLEAQLREYYRVRRWSADGKPTYECLVELGLAEAAADLYGA